MRFKDFMINYFSPYYFVTRILWLIYAAIAFFFVTGVAIAMAGWSLGSSVVAGGLIASVLVWNALRPWKIGASYNDVVGAVTIIKEKIKNKK